MEREACLRLPLQTSHLILRDFVPQDWAAVHAYASDPDVVRYMFWGPRSVSESRAYVRLMIESQAERPRRTFELAVERRLDHRLVGACDLTLVSGDTADLGYVLTRGAWGQGYATEAAQALVTAGFTDLRLQKIVATCDPANHASARVLEKAGLQRLRYLHGHCWAKGRWWNSWLYQIDRPAAIDSASSDA